MHSSRWSIIPMSHARKASPVGCRLTLYPCHTLKKLVCLKLARLTCFLPQVYGFSSLCKGTVFPLHQFPRSKSVTSWRRQKSVVSVVSCRFPNSITTTCCQLVADLLAVSLTSPQQVGNFGYGDVTGLRGNVCRQMDFGHNRTEQWYSHKVANISYSSTVQQTKTSPIGSV